MKAAFKKDNEVYLKDIQSIPVKPDQIRIKVVACGICGTDLQSRP